MKNEDKEKFKVSFFFLSLYSQGLLPGSLVPMLSGREWENEALPKL